MRVTMVGSARQFVLLLSLSETTNIFLQCCDEQESLTETVTLLFHLTIYWVKPKLLGKSLERLILFHKTIIRIHLKPELTILSEENSVIYI